MILLIFFFIVIAEQLDTYLDIIFFFDHFVYYLKGKFPLKIPKIPVQKNVFFMERDYE